jgi:shikimate dehydrogenase
VTAGIALAVLGDPLAYTLSPELHRAGLQAVGLTGRSEALRTSPAELELRLRRLAERGCRGVNLTHPLKAAVLPLLARTTDAARIARSVNTVGFEPNGWWGDSTDGAGFLDLIDSLHCDAGERIVLLGAGGAARSLALALRRNPAAEIVVSARRPAAAEWPAEIPVRMTSWRGSDERRALAEATLVVNATPLATVEALPLAEIAERALIVDLVYGPEVTPWVQAARGSGRRAFDGLGLLLFQARRALMAWLEREVPVELMARAVGWPR